MSAPPRRGGKEFFVRSSDGSERLEEFGQLEGSGPRHTQSQFVDADARRVREARIREAQLAQAEMTRKLAPIIPSIGKHGYEYHIYEFGAHKWRTILTPEDSHYPPQSFDPLVVTKKAMIWRHLSGFIVFDINTEKLYWKGSSPLVGEPKMVVKGGEDLCCCYVRYAETVVDVWVLVDYTKWLWERKYAVNFDWEKNRCPSRAWSAHIPQVTRNTKVVSIQGNILVLDIKGAGAQLHCYDLVSNASWIVDTNKFNGETQKTWYGRRRRVDKHFTWYHLLGL
ncbi:Unknown protein [Striga hermonthica]|uniref:F-box associated domain-containing protein n=1 Tax=Striga hermonthica TaxID=68872 RepID=A0A9N7NAB2_STRHE|nr:Unknown protein [Striga hermonthica]